MVRPHEVRGKVGGVLVARVEDATAAVVGGEPAVAKTRVSSTRTGPGARAAGAVAVRGPILAVPAEGRRQIRGHARPVAALPHPKAEPSP